MGGSAGLLSVEAENGIGGRLPVDAELLHVDDAVGLNDLVDEGAHLVLVHGPNLVKPVLVRLFKALELVLQLLELLRELLVVVGQLDVLSLVVLALTIKLLFHCPKNVLVTALLGFEGVNGVAVDLFALLEYFMVEL